MKLPYYEDLVKKIYTNLKFTVIDLSIDISSQRIEIKVWMNVTNLRYDGIKLTLGTILEGVNYDRAVALSSMIREEVHGENIRNVGSLTTNDMLCSQSSNFSQMLNEDIFMLWCIKNNILINWPIISCNT